MYMYTFQSMIKIVDCGQSHTSSKVKLNNENVLSNSKSRESFCSFCAVMDIQAALRVDNLFAA